MEKYNVNARVISAPSVLVKRTFCLFMVVLSILISAVTQAQVTISITDQTNVSCNGGNDGWIIATVSGGTANYSYAWSNGSSTSNTAFTSDTISALNAGTYNVTVTDANSDTAIASALISQPAPIIHTLDSLVIVTNYGTANGLIQITTIGGTPPYSYNWSNGATTQDVFGLSGGPIKLTVTDSNGCTRTDSSFIHELPLLSNPVDNTIYTTQLPIAYNLPLSPVAGSVELSITGDTTARLFFNDSLSNSMIWDLTTDPTLLPEVDSSSVTSLPDGIYDVELIYFPEGGFGSISVSNNNISIDTKTDTPDLVDPISGSINGNPIDISYTLPEPPLSGSVTLTFQGDTIVTLNLNNNQSNSFSWDPTSDPSSLTQVISSTANSLPSGVYTVTLSYQDELGNPTVMDMNTNVSICAYPPTVLTKDSTFVLDDDGQVTVLPSAINNTTFSYCGIDSIWINKSLFTCSDIGTNVVTLTVKDGNGSIANQTATITIQDTTAPTAITQDVTIQLDQLGLAGIVADDIDNGSFDNCTIASKAVNPSVFTCSEIGNNTVTLTVTDIDGNNSSQTAIVTVEDNVGPSVAVRDITIQLDTTGQAAIAANDIDNGSTDKCGIASSIVAPDSFTCNDLGENTVTLTVTDVNGNSSNQSASVIVEDNIPPAVVTRNITIQLNTSGSASITPNDIDNGSSDNCSIASKAVTPVSFTCNEVGNNMVTLTVTDMSGNIGTATAIVTIEDSTSPTAVAQDITVQLDSTGQVSISSNDIDNGTSDNCGIATKSVVPNNFTCSGLGVNPVTLTVTDVNGNSSSSTATVTVEDNMYPIVVIKDITVQLDSSGQASISGNDIDNGSSDNCGIATKSVVPNNFTCSSLGTNPVTLTVTDVNGNSSSQIATVMIEDNIFPVATTKDITIQLDSSGQASILADDIDNGSWDNCSIASKLVAPNSFSCTEVGVNTVTLTVVDVNGNSSSQTATVTVEDNIPLVAFTQDITIQLDASGQANIIADDVDNNSFDNCTIANKVVTPDSFTCSEIGDHTVTFTATDNHGNTSSNTATVTVEDNTPPTVLTQDISVQLDSTGQGSITAADVDNGSYDNCSVATVAVAPDIFTCNQVGNNTVTLTITDVNGNSSTATAIVTIQDNIIPVVTCKDVEIFLDNSGLASIDSSMIDNASTDNCGISNLALSKYNFSCSDLGTNTVDLTGTDGNGNQNSCTAQVTVKDIIPPTALCTSIDVYLDNTGFVEITPGDIDGGSSDNCGIVQSNVIPNNLDCQSLGEQTVKLTVTDASGNTASCSASVLVMDNTKPSITLNNATVYLDSTGQVQVQQSDILTDTWDNCTVQDIIVEDGLFTCQETGINTVTVKAQDAAGNEFTTTTQVDVLDTIAPVIRTKSVTVYLDQQGKAAIAPTDVDDGCYDNCSVDQMTLSKTVFDCNDKGPNNVVLTVTDIHGNASTATATVNVTDALAPTIECAGDVIVCADNASGAIVQYTYPVAYDNCATTNITQTEGLASGSNFPVGETQVSYKAEDAFSNQKECHFKVTVQTATPIGLRDTNLCEIPTVLLLVDNRYSDVQWSTGAETYGITVNTPGDYWVTAMDVNGCVASDSVRVDSCAKTSVGISPVAEANNEILIYPNPTKDIIFIQSQREGGMEKVEVLDGQGRVIKQKEIDGSPTTNVKISLGEFDTGIYFIRVLDQQDKYTYRKVILTK